MIDPRRAVSILVAMAMALAFSPCGRAEAGADPPDGREPIQSEVTEEVEVMLFQLNFLARDKKGQPVTDLRADEITILDQGEPQRIAFLEPYYRQAAAAPAPEPEGGTEAPAQPAEQAAAPPPAASRARWIVLFFDNYASQPASRLLAVDAARSYVEERLRPEDLISIVSFTGELHVIQSFTSDRWKLEGALQRTAQEMDRAVSDRYGDLDLLIDAMQRCEGAALPANCATGYGGAYEDERRREARTLLTAITHFLRSLASISEPKMLLMFSNGFARSSSADVIDAARVALGESVALGMVFSHDLDVNRWYDDLVAAAVTARTSVFTLNPGGMKQNYLISAERGSPLDEATNTFQIDIYSRSDRNYQSSLTDMARRTGGTSSQKPDVTQALRDILELSSGMYSVGYYPNRPVPSAPHDVKIRIKRKKVEAVWPHDIPHIRPVSPLTGEMTLAPEACSEGGRRALSVKLRLDVDSLMFESIEDTLSNNFSLFLSVLDENGQRTLHRDYRFFNISYGADGAGGGERVDPVIEQTLIVPCRPLLVRASAVDSVSGARIDFEQQLQK